MKKKCKSCGKVKLLKEFHKDIRKSDGLAYCCKKCSIIRSKIYYKKLAKRTDSQIIIPLEKKCAKCGHIKLAKEFCRCKRNIDGLQIYCKICSSQIKKQYRQKLLSRKDNDVVIPKRKRCSGCKKVKSARSFFMNRGNRDGLDFYCKECRSKRNRESSHIQEYFKLYREVHKDELNRKARIYYHENILEQHKRSKNYRKKNREKTKQRNQKWYQANKNKIRSKRTLYVRHKRREDANFRMASNLRGRINTVLGRQNIKKTKHTMELVGCTISFLRSYLESKFQYGMTWENYGKGKEKWCVDHIKPCAAFDLTKIKNQKKCFAYGNLQPLWNKDNFAKSSFYNGNLIRT